MLTDASASGAGGRGGHSAGGGAGGSGGNAEDDLLVDRPAVLCTMALSRELARIAEGHLDEVTVGEYRVM